MIGVVIIFIFSALLALIIYLYQEHVDYLDKKIEGLQVELELTADCLSAHEEMVEDLKGYYEKWREAVAELDEANQKIWELDEEIKHLENQIQFLREYDSEYM